MYKLFISWLPESIQKIYQNYIYNKWSKKKNFYSTSDYAKQSLVKKYASKYSIDTFIETGTYQGDMVWTQRNNFKKIISIELGKDLAEFSTKRFKKLKNIEILRGDSGIVLQKIVPELNTKALFYLDAHYSGKDTIRGDKDTAIGEELNSIINSNIEHILIINDAHSFIGERDYPVLEVIYKYVLYNHPKSIINIEYDCIIVEIIIDNSTENNSEDTDNTE